MSPVWAEVERDVIVVRGPDAVGFLQGQVSQDIATLAIGASAWTFVLQPTGKVDGFARVTRTDDDALPARHRRWRRVEACSARLTRFKLRIKADIEPLPAGAASRSRGAGARERRRRWRPRRLVGNSPRPPTCWDPTSNRPPAPSGSTPTSSSDSASKRAGRRSAPS